MSICHCQWGGYLHECCRPWWQYSRLLHLKILTLYHRLSAFLSVLMSACLRISFPREKASNCSCTHLIVRTISALTVDGLVLFALRIHPLYLRYSGLAILRTSGFIKSGTPVFSFRISAAIFAGGISFPNSNPSASRLSTQLSFKVYLKATI